MPQHDFEADNAILTAYVKRFGPLPDRRIMSEEDLLALVDKAAEGLARGRALSDAEWGVAGDLPPNVTI